MALVMGVHGQSAVNINPDDSPDMRGKDDYLLPEDPRIPVPEALKVKVIRGESITIDLKTVGDPVSQRVDYVVRSSTKAGTLTRPKGKDTMRSQMSVDYTPNPDSDETMDNFTFGASYPNGRVSAPVLVQISIIEPVPNLELPPNVSFGKTMIGSESVRTIPIKNTGTGVFDEAIELPKPWAWVAEPGETTCRIDREETKLVTFRYRPTEVGTQTFRMGWDDDREKTLLVGEGYIPFKINADEIVLKFDPETRQRQGEVTVASYHPQGLPLRVEKESRVQVHQPGSDILRQGQSTLVKFHLPANDVEGVEDFISFYMGEYRQILPLRADPPPAFLVINAEEPRLDFGVLQPGEESRRVISLYNIGGEEMTFTMEVKEPFLVVEGEPERTIGPLQESSWTLGFRPGEPGDFFGSVTLGNEGAGPIMLEGMARSKPQAGDEYDLAPTVLGPSESGMAVSSSTPPKSSSNSSYQKPAGGSKSSPTRPPASSGANTSNPPASYGSDGGYADLVTNAIKQSSSRPPTLDDIRARDNMVSELNRTPVRVNEQGYMALPPMVTRDGMMSFSPFRQKTDVRLPRVKKVGYAAKESTGLTLIWSRPDDMHANFGVEIRGTRLNKEKQRYEAVWVPYKKVKYELNDKTVLATVRGLRPDSTYYFRAFSVGPDETSGLPSPEVIVRTDVQLANYGSIMILGLIVLVLGMLGTGYGLLKHNGVI